MVKEDFLDSQNVWIVLAGGLDANGKLPNFVINRLKRLRSLASPFDPVIFSSLFTLNVPQKFNNDGFVYSEAKQMLEYFAWSGGNPERCFIENSSFDTVGSAFFLRNNFDFLLRSRNVNVISSAFHIERVKMIFNFVFALKPKIYDLSGLRFYSSIDPRNIGLRRMKEKAAEQKFKNEVKNINDLEEFKWWLFDNHTNYNRQFNSVLTHKMEHLYY